MGFKHFSSSFFTTPCIIVFCNCLRGASIGNRSQRLFLLFRLTSPLLSELPLWAGAAVLLVVRSCRQVGCPGLVRMCCGLPRSRCLCMLLLYAALACVCVCTRESAACARCFRVVPFLFSAESAPGQVHRGREQSAHALRWHVSNHTRYVLLLDILAPHFQLLLKHWPWGLKPGDQPDTRSRPSGVSVLGMACGRGAFDKLPAALEALAVLDLRSIGGSSGGAVA